jgi:hypothetical protein
MTTNTDNIVKFFEQIKSLTFWQRIFKWSQLKSLSYEAYGEFKSLFSETVRIGQEFDATKNELSVMKNDNEHLKSAQSTLTTEFDITKSKLDDSIKKASDLSATLATKEEALRQAEAKTITLETEIALAKEKINHLAQENSDLKSDNAVFEQTENDRRTKYANDVAALNSIQLQIQTDRNAEIAERQNEELEKLTLMKETWSKHQDSVKETIKLICQKNTIDYVDKVPFKGSPDNTLKICDEYVIFDAKSPASEDLSNFSSYIKLQTESVKKYIKEENVKKEVFLVIPSNTVGVIDQFSYNMADYTVYVVTPDSLEPIILSLKKLEEYEFVEQLSPEERDNVCRVIGKFSHMTKRRIQIDQFFEQQFLEILSKCATDLPHEIIQKVIEYERAEKLNPPQEKRAKLISIKELEADSQSIRREAEAKSIAFPASVQQEIRSLPLYDDESSSEK